tara:strand:+ start:769 stop:1827 length:1059 start_codon:yes stop_codon:yes gene_type:complete
MITLTGFGYEKQLKNPSKVFNNTWIDKSFINGPSIKTFEQQFANYCDTDESVAVGSCTSALQLSLLALEVGRGDEVITVPYTWVSSVEVIKQVGATPVFVDINKDDMCIDTTAVAKKITNKTKAIIGVDLFGNVCDIDSLKEFNLPVIQDAAQSTGAEYKNKKVGSLSNLTCFSFYPTKNLGCWGDAGAVTGDKKLLDTIRQLRNHGQRERFAADIVGWNSRMDTIQAEILLNKLPLLDKHNQRRIQIAKIYDSELYNIVGVPKQNENSKHVYHQYVICHPNVDQIQEWLHSRKIQSRRYYPTPLHKTMPYKDSNSYPVSEYYSANALAIPVHQYLTDKEVGTIIKAIKQAT